ncbi:saccharopine dehydrogenase NADP-binding domain-containing protein [Lysobacter sp. TAF61]|uniref:saccharopine dehydrogenase NADP-binding domain-containing protein n=1 Tax=Lysobacter sp. TAF61 TaxID=3233072 RepID=UPI003F97B97F
MGNRANIAVYGASGHTGQLVATELSRAGHVPLLVGREMQGLQRVADRLGGNARTAVAAVDDPAALNVALAGVDVLINCAGPQSDTAYPLALAAINHGAHYLDTNAVEQLTAKRLFDELHGEARMARVAIIPGMATFGGLADLLAGRAARDLGSVDEVSVGYLVTGWIPTRGSQATARKSQGTPRLKFSAGQFSTVAEPPSVGTFDFGPPNGVREVVARYPGVEVATIPMHVAAQQVTVQMALSTVQEFRAHDPEVAAQSPAALRKQTGYLVVVALRHARGEKRMQARGTDIYGFTATMMAAAIERMGPDFARVGVLSPGQAFDPEEFLNELSHRGLRVQME